MGAINGIQGMVAAYLASPQGQETIRRFLDSPQGKEAIDAYLATPGGQQVARLLLLKSLDRLDIPDDVKAMIRRALDEPAPVCV
ncbi:MAG: hypothetical protein WC342_02765 [Methanoregula sp.]|jgi:hypothetical protein